MRHHRIPTLVLIATLVAVSAPAAWAGGKLRVVVLGFDGPKRQAKDATRAVSKVVRGEHKLLSAKKFNRAAKRARMRKITRRGVAKVAQSAGFDVLIKGQVRKSRRRYTLVLTVYEGKSGKKVETLRFPMRRKKLSGKERRKLSTELLDVLSWVEPLDDFGGDDDEAEVTGDDWTVEEAKPERSERRRSSRSSRSSRDEDSYDSYDDEDDSPQFHDDDEVPDLGGSSGGDLSKSSDSSSSGANGGPALSVRAGMAFMGRNLSFNYQPSLAANERPTAYSSTPVPGAHVSGELFPLRLLGVDNKLAGLGVTMALDRAVGMKSRLVNDGGEATADTTLERMNFGVRLELQLGKLSFAPHVGYNTLTHEIHDNDGSFGVPPVNYAYLDFGAELQFNATSKVSVFADVAYLQINAAGPMLENDAYGAAMVKGIDVDAGLAYRISKRLELRGGVRYTQMAFDFKGTGKLTNDLDGDPDKDVGGAIDAYAGGYVAAGVSY